MHHLPMSETNLQEIKFGTQCSNHRILRHLFSMSLVKMRLVNITSIIENDDIKI